MNEKIDYLKILHSIDPKRIKDMMRNIQLPYPYNNFLKIRNGALLTKYNVDVEENPICRSIAPSRIRFDVHPSTIALDIQILIDYNHVNNLISIERREQAQNIKERLKVELNELKEEYGKILFEDMIDEMLNEHIGTKDV